MLASIALLHFSSSSWSKQVKPEKALLCLYNIQHLRLLQAELHWWDPVSSHCRATEPRGQKPGAKRRPAKKWITLLLPGGSFFRKGNKIKTVCFEVPRTKYSARQCAQHSWNPSLFIHSTCHNKWALLFWIDRLSRSKKLPRDSRNFPDPRNSLKPTFHEAYFKLTTGSLSLV